MAEIIKDIPYEPPGFGLIFGFIPMKSVSIQDVRLDLKSSEIKAIV
jgi:hypothetical protein